MKKLIFVAVLILLSSCQNEDLTESMSPEEVAFLYVKYTYSMDGKGLNSLLCEKCETKPYLRTPSIKRDLSYGYEKDNVDIYDPDAYDFNNVKCAISSRDESVVNLVCKGSVFLFSKIRTLKKTWNWDRKITLYHEGSRLTICPPVCDQSKEESQI